jgi:nucleoid DNA-binding protein
LRTVSRHVLTSINLNCFNVKKREERKGRGMTTGQTNKMD